MNYDEFTTYFPEFSELNEYPQARIEFWLSYASNLLDQSMWSSLYPQGIALLTAHQLTIDKLQGNAQGVITSTSVDAVSESYDNKLISYANAGIYNKTMYGLQFYQLVRMVGCKVLQFN